jgi:hypothetical protein
LLLRLPAKSTLPRGSDLPEVSQGDGLGRMSAGAASSHPPEAFCDYDNFLGFVAIEHEEVS